MRTPARRRSAASVPRARDRRRAPAEPFTGMMSVPDRRAGRPPTGRANGRQTGGFATSGAESAPGQERRGAGQPQRLRRRCHGRPVRLCAAQRQRGNSTATGPPERHPRSSTEAGQQYPANDQYGHGPVQRHGAAVRRAGTTTVLVSTVAGYDGASAVRPLRGSTARCSPTARWQPQRHGAAQRVAGQFNGTGQQYGAVRARHSSTVSEGRPGGPVPSWHRRAGQ